MPELADPEFSNLESADLESADLELASAEFANWPQIDSNRDWPGVTHAHFRIHLQRMPSPVRDLNLRQAKSRVPQVPRHQAGTSALGLRACCEGFIVLGNVVGNALGGPDGRLRVLRRSAWAGR